MLGVDDEGSFSRNCCVIKVLFPIYSKHETLSDPPFLCLDRQTETDMLNIDLSSQTAAITYFTAAAGRVEILAS